MSTSDVGSPSKIEEKVAERNEKVMEMVKGELEKDANVSLASLYGRAKAIDPSVEELSLRQFHARYPLQVKRRKAHSSGRQKPAPKAVKKGTRSSKTTDQESPASGKRKRRSAGDSGDFDRERVRTLFLEFATDFASAESRTDIVRVISSVDGYVNRLSELVRR